MRYRNGDAIRIVGAGGSVDAAREALQSGQQQEYYEAQARQAAFEHQGRLAAQRQREAKARQAAERDAAITLQKLGIVARSVEAQMPITADPGSAAADQQRAAQREAAFTLGTQLAIVDSAAWVSQGSPFIKAALPHYTSLSEPELAGPTGLLTAPPVYPNPYGE